MLLESGDLSPRFLPAVKGISAEKDATEKRRKHFVEIDGFEDWDRPAMLVTPIEIHATGKGEWAGAIAGLGKNF